MIDIDRKNLLRAMNAPLGRYCFADRHTSYCPLPCAACAEECPPADIVTWGDPPRFFVSIWHGEGGSIAMVYDRQEPDRRCLGYSSTTRDGAKWRAIAQKLADVLNDIEILKARKENTTP